MNDDACRKRKRFICQGPPKPSTPESRAAATADFEKDIDQACDDAATEVLGLRGGAE